MSAWNLSSSLGYVIVVRGDTSSLKEDQWLVLSLKSLGFALKQSDMLVHVIPRER